jgi:uncharacterized membrane protein (DUF485 family)
MPTRTADLTREIISEPSFREHAAGRARLRRGLSIVTLPFFFGSITLAPLASAALGRSIWGSDIPVGIEVVLALVAVVVSLTGIYVKRSNIRFDCVTQPVR